MSQNRPSQHPIRRALGMSAGLVLGVSALTAPALGQAQEQTNAQLLDDFAFFVLTSNIELAEASANALLERDIDPTDFVGIIEDTPGMEERFEKAYLQAMRMSELQDVAAELESLYTQGRRDRARNPDEIARNIELLTGPARARLMARQFLKDAGEYAVPQLLEVMLNSRDRLLLAEVHSLLTDMGRDAVNPLSAALPHLTPDAQETVAVILGGARYRTALPYLYDVHQSTTSPQVRDATRKAIERIDGAFQPNAPVYLLYRELGSAYLTESNSFTSFPGEEHQLLWDFIPSIGLNPTAILTAVYHEAESMRLAERALELNPADSQTVALWIYANFAREIDQPEGYENPAYGPERREPIFYAVAAGSEPVQQVLGEALDTADTQVARRAIEALDRSTGDAGLWAGMSAGQRPLIDALTYPDRRTQFDAAIALGNAAPRTDFDGADRVVPILASAIRDAGSRYAVVVANDVERQQEIRSNLEGEGYTVLPPARSLSDAAEPISRAPGVDLLVVDLPSQATEETIRQARRNARLRATPLLALLPFDEWQRVAPAYDNEDLTSVARAGLSAEQFLTQVEELVVAASGAPIGEEEAAEYARTALDVLHELAVGNNPVLRVGDASPALIAAVREKEGDIKLKVAEVLSYIGREDVQTALMDAALNAADEAERVAILNLTADSAKRYGNLLAPRQVPRLFDLIETGTDPEATAAAALMGALNLPGDRIVPLILEN